MTRTNTLLSAPNLPSLITQVNAYLSPLLTCQIDQLDYEILDDDSTGGQTYQMLLQVVDTGVLMSAPFVVQSFTGQNAVVSMAALITYIGANPTVFVSPPFYQPILGGRRRTRYNPILVVTTTDLTNGTINWSGSAGGGAPSGPAGGDLSGAYPNPQVFVGQVTVSPLAALTTLDTVAVASFRSMKWAIQAWKAGTSAAYESTISSTNDGTTATFQEESIVIQPANGGVFDFTYSVTISGGNLLLQVTPLTTGWVFKLRRLSELTT